MKKHIILSVVCGSILGLTGCDKAPESKPSSTSTAADPASIVDATAKKLTETTKAAARNAEVAAQAAGDAVKAADATTALITTVQTAIKQSQELVAQNKLPEAASQLTNAQDALKNLSALKLTPEQEKLVADLKAKLEQALAAVKAAGGDALKKVQGLLPVAK